jgi:hypothetical protein
MLIGSGTDVTDRLVVTGSIVPGPNTIVISSAMEYGAVREEIVDVTVFVSKLTPEYSSTGLVSVPAGTLQSGGAKPLAWSIQLSISVVPAPAVEVVERVLEKPTLGGVVGARKSCADIQIRSLSVAPPVFMILTVASSKEVLMPEVPAASTDRTTPAPMLDGPHGINNMSTPTVHVMTAPPLIW